MTVMTYNENRNCAERNRKIQIALSWIAQKVSRSKFHR